MGPARRSIREGDARSRPTVRPFVVSARLPSDDDTGVQLRAPARAKRGRTIVRCNAMLGGRLLATEWRVRCFAGEGLLSIIEVHLVEMRVEEFCCARGFTRKQPKHGL